MTLSMAVVHAPESARHAVPTGVFCGVTIENDELPIRAEVILDACAGAGATIVDATTHGLDPIARVHDARFLDLMAEIYEWWTRDGDDMPPLVTPYYFPPVAGVHGGRIDRRPATARAAIGYYAMDTMTVIGEGTWEGAVAAVDAALTAADLVVAGAGAAFAISRPPGHHAGPAFFGGSCYLNNAAAAAAHLRSNGATRVAIIDIDAHHGNGTQAICWNDPAMFYASVHIDPGAGWFPHTVGYADEIDDCDTNLNVPVAPGTGDVAWLESLDTIVGSVREFGPEALVVSLGVDAAAEDPNSPLGLTPAGFAAAGRRLADLVTPTVLVLEGGYVPGSLGDLVLSVLTEFN